MSLKHRFYYWKYVIQKWFYIRHRWLKWSALLYMEIVLYRKKRILWVGIFSQIISFTIVNVLCKDFINLRSAVSDGSGCAIDQHTVLIARRNPDVVSSNLTRSICFIIENIFCKINIYLRIESTGDSDGVIHSCAVLVDSTRCIR